MVCADTLSGLVSEDAEKWLSELDLDPAADEPRYIYKGVALKK